MERSRSALTSLVIGGGVLLALCAVNQDAAADTLIKVTFTGQPQAGDCPGAFGTPFGACSVTGPDGEKYSPVIEKINYNDDGTEKNREVNTLLFPTVNGNEFQISFDSAAHTSGSWTYSQGAGDPDVRYWSTKGGSGQFNLFWLVPDATAACSTAYSAGCLAAALVTTGSTWTNVGLLVGNGNTPGLSHIAFYDHVSAVPLPAALPLFAGGLGLMGWLARRKRRQAAHA